MTPGIKRRVLSGMSQPAASYLVILTPFGLQYKSGFLVLLSCSRTFHSTVGRVCLPGTVWMDIWIVAVDALLWPGPPPNSVVLNHTPACFCASPCPTMPCVLCKKMKAVQSCFECLW